MVPRKSLLADCYTDDRRPVSVHVLRCKRCIRLEFLALVLYFTGKFTFEEAVGSLSADSR